jgi:cephalosporin hydroxylase
MNLYEEILAVTKDLHGWCEPPKQITLANLVLALRPSIIVEIGVWGGKSLFPMAIAARNVPHIMMPAKIIAIDPWAASESVKGQEEADAKWWSVQDQHEEVYRKFLTKVHQIGLNRSIEIQRLSSNVASVPQSIGILHLDGNHGVQALADIKKFGPAIVQGGACVLDDLNWSGGAVGQAAEWLKKNGFMELHPLGTGAVFIKL